MVQMAMIPMRIRTRCQDSSSRDWSVDINVILKALSYSPSPVLRTPSPLRAREKLVLFPSKDSTQAIWCNISLALRGSRRLSISEYVPEGVRRTGEGLLIIPIQEIVVRIFLHVQFTHLFVYSIPELVNVQFLLC